MFSILASILVYFETYGCQMNVNDTEIVWSVLDKNGFVRTSNVKEVENDLPVI